MLEDAAQAEYLLKKMQRKLFWLGLTTYPMVGFIRPKLLEINGDSVRVKIPLGRRSKNHLNSMYFGALLVGADLAGGLQAYYYQEQLQVKISFAFKQVQANFIKRAQTDVTFTNSQGSQVKEGILQSRSTGERTNIPMQIMAFNNELEPVAEFDLTLSVKVPDL